MCHCDLGDGKKALHHGNLYLYYNMSFQLKYSSQCMTALLELTACYFTLSRNDYYHSNFRYISAIEYYWLKSLTFKHPVLISMYWASQRHCSLTLLAKGTFRDGSDYAIGVDYIMRDTQHQHFVCVRGFRRTLIRSLLQVFKCLQRALWQQHDWGESTLGTTGVSLPWARLY